jgi:general secretion pathway protein B
MSIILDALRRADQSRDEHERSSVPVRAPSSRRRRGTRWMTLAAVLVGLNLVAAAIWISRPGVGPEPQPVAVTPPRPPSGRATSAPPTTTLAAPVDRVDAPARPVAEVVAELVPVTAATGAPLLGELSLAFRQTLPSVRLDVHVYADDPERRFIMLDLERLQEGGISRSGLEVVEILQDGVILRWRGQDFLQPR